MPEIIRLTPGNIDSAADRAAEFLRQGGVVLYPTDTLYGLAVDALSRNSLEKLYRIKGRDEGKPVHSVFASLDAAEPYAEINDAARKLGEKFLPGRLTILVRKKSDVPDWATSGRDTFGIRIPDNAFCLSLAQKFGKPYTATSANISGMPPERSVEKILVQLGDAGQEIDLIIDAGEIPKSLATTVVDVSGEKVEVVRAGAIPSELVWQALGK